MGLDRNQQENRKKLLSPQEQGILAAKAEAERFEQRGRVNGSARNLENHGQDNENIQSDNSADIMPFNWEKLSIAHEYDEICRKMPEKSFFQKLIKGFNYICSVAMFTTAIYRFVTYDAKKIQMDGFYLAFTSYLLVFGGLLTAAEYQYLKVLQYIEFLATQRGKGFFMLWIGILLFEPSKQVDLWASLSLTIVGLFNIILSCMKDKPQDQNQQNEKNGSNKGIRNIQYKKKQDYQSLLDDVESEPMLEKESEQIENRQNEDKVVEANEYKQVEKINNEIQNSRLSENATPAPPQRNTFTDTSQFTNERPKDRDHINHLESRIARMKINKK